MKKLLLFSLLMLAIGGSLSAQTPISIVAGVVTADVGRSSNYKILVNQTVTSVVFTSISTPAAGQNVSLFFTENATGGFSVAFGGNISNPCTVVTTASTTTVCQFQYDATSATWFGVGGGGGITSVASIPGQPGLNAVPVTSGLMAEYRMLATETPASLVDYSGNGRTATGTIGTAPTIIAGSGGVSFGGVGAIQLPASLNSALTIMVFVGGTYVGNGGAIIAGNGAAGNLMLVTPTQVTGTNDNVISALAGTYHNLRLLTGQIDVAPFAGVGSYPRAAMPAAANITWTMNGAAADVVYWNGVATNSYITQGNATGNGHQTSGNFQLGGIASASCTNWSGQLCNYLNGNIYYAAFWNRVLSATEVMQVTTFVNNQMAQRGLSLSPYFPANGTVGVNYSLAVDGDSLSCGACATVTPLPAAPYSSYLFGLNSANFSTTNNALGGRSLLLHNVPGATQAIDPLFYPYGSGNLALCLCGTNDGSDSQYQGGIRQWASDRRAIGWKTLVMTLPDGIGDAFKNSRGAWLRQHWREFADDYVDLAGDPALGANGARLSTDFFTTDNLHIQDSGIISHEAPWIKRGINRFFGNHSFSAATTYSSAALAPTATTAGTSSATQNVITFAATPANCTAGTMITFAGITPAGYNGDFYITSTTGTTVTVRNATSQSSLAAISVQGTGVCPQQQDADEYVITNYTGNFSLQPCKAFTDHYTYLRNINAGAITLLPFGTETISGAGATPATVAANTTAIIQCQLVSAAAGGDNPVRLQ